MSPSRVQGSGNRFRVLRNPAPPPIPEEVVKKFKLDLTDHKVYDMTGNVREWCLDPYKPRAEQIPANNDPRDPLVDQPGTHIPPNPNEIDPNGSYVVRGGSFDRDQDKEMVFLRDKLPANGAEALFDVGFRVVIDCPPQPPPADAAR